MAYEISANTVHPLGKYISWYSFAAMELWGTPIGAIGFHLLVYRPKVHSNQKMR